MSFAQPKQPHRQGGIPLAPMLDVMFLLLIFFVVTSSFRAEEHQIDVELPSAEASEPQSAQRSEVVVNVAEDGAIMIGSAEYSPEQLEGVLARLVEDYPDERVIIRGDRESRYNRIVTVMDVARAAGVEHIYFATVRSADETGG